MQDDFLWRRRKLICTFWVGRTEVSVSEWNDKKRTLAYIMKIVSIPFSLSPFSLPLTHAIPLFFSTPQTNPLGPNETHSTGEEIEEVADPEKAYEVVSETKNPDLPSGKK